MKMRTIEWRGVVRVLKDVLDEYGIDRRTYARRIERGWDQETAIITPSQGNNVTKKKPMDEATQAILAQRNQGVRTRILNSLMQTFYDNPAHFKDWIHKEMKNDYGKFFKEYILPFLPKGENPLLDSKPQKPTNIHIEFNSQANPVTLDYHPTEDNEE